MLTGQEIVYVGNEWFTENKTSSHHIAEILACCNRVLYVQGSGQRRPTTSRRDIKKLVSKLGKALKHPVQVQDNLFISSPLIVPLHSHSLVRRFNSTILKWTVKRACKKMGFRNPILWILAPHFGSLAGGLNEIGTVYYCVDEYSAQPNVDSQAIRKMEAELLRKSNVVFTVSELLRIDKSKINPNCYLSLHGVDTAHFGKALNRQSKPLPDISAIPRPIIGFFGLIQERVDLSLINYLASNLKDASFVLIGMVSQDISEVRGLPNVYFLGPKPYEDLPEYMQYFDVCIMPYKLNDEMVNSNPKKLREYLASGKPVVSVRIKEVERYSKYVYIADNNAQFLDLLKEAIAENSTERMQDRMKAMEKESWEYRAEQISSIVSKHISISRSN